MERTNTQPIFNSQEFDQIIHHTSFNDKFSITDISSILEDSSDSNDRENLREVDNEDFTFEEQSLINNSSLQFVDMIDNKPPTNFMESDEDEVIDFYNIDVSNEVSFVPSLAFDSWPGSLNFNINLNLEKYGNQKWCYSSLLNRLYLTRGVAAPIEIFASSFDDLVLNITPVFKKVQHFGDPIQRCHNHRISDEDRGIQNAEHIIQLENAGVVYKKLGERCCVDIPLTKPAPGEDHVVLFLKAGCWNTCVGPSRKTYCLIFTLFSMDGSEIGRKVLDIKSCQCPLRDMANEEKKFNKGRKQQQQQNGGKRLVTQGSPRRACKKIKYEKPSGEPTTYETVVVLSEIAPDVKRYVNSLMALKYSKNDPNFVAPYPDY